jgi:hypothetical protein
LAACEIGKALTVLSEIERATLLLRHGQGWDIDAIRLHLRRILRRRAYLRRTVLDDLAEAETVLGEELRRRDLLGDDPEE